MLEEAGGIRWGAAAVMEFCSGEWCCCFWGLLDPGFGMGMLADVEVEAAVEGGGVCRGLERGLGSWIAFCIN
jgi:hypothetical protein